jgi:23S rRNA (guanosine2251-2'-O)-methyltransferase
MVLFLQKAIKMRQLTNEEHGRLDVEGFRSAEKNKVIVILDNVRSLNNIGSIFRSCDAFRIEKLILCGISTPPPHRDIHKSALGAELSVDWQYFEKTIDAISFFQSNGYQVFAIEQTTVSIPLNDFNLNGPTAIVFGHEIHGVSPDVLALCEAAVEIPQFGTKHSLNVAVSVGIVLWKLTN